MSKGRPIQTISALEKFYNKATENARKNGREYDINWRIHETPSWYVIEIEDDGDEIAFYLSDSWDEIVDFCGKHYNYGYRLIYGRGSTEHELTAATVKYIESLGKKVNPA